MPVRARLPQGSRETSLARSGLAPQMQPSTSIGRESQIRIEPWANPAKVTYVLVHLFQLLPPAAPSSYLAATRSRDPALGSGKPGNRRRTGLEVSTRVTDSTHANWQHGTLGQWRRGADSSICVEVLDG